MKTILVALMASKMALAAPTSCDLAITACKGLVAVQENQIEHLETDITLLEKKLDEEEKEIPSIPVWVYLLLGFAAGVSADRLVR